MQRLYFPLAITSASLAGPCCATWPPSWPAYSSGWQPCTALSTLLLAPWSIEPYCLPTQAIIDEPPLSERLPATTALFLLLTFYVCHHHERWNFATQKNLQFTCHCPFPGCVGSNHHPRLVVLQFVAPSPIGCRPTPTTRQKQSPALTQQTAQLFAASNKTA